ncbi:hypothetical protein [Paracoccus pacificus]|uniref:Uncharacterized protein n=1 Tax=Paracoccus pacificus TaxID=1463598 RepID=A0ABW4RDX5_9RHOB
MRRVDRPTRVGCVAVGAVLSLVTLAAPGFGVAAGCCDPASPYRAGEAMPDTPATCETLGGWLDRMPDTASRVSMAVTGPLTMVKGDGTLAYLIICPDGGAQAMCVTYETLGMQPGEVVTIAGGVVPAEGARVILDPCLAYRPAQPQENGTG